MRYAVQTRDHGWLGSRKCSTLDLNVKFQLYTMPSFLWPPKKQFILARPFKPICMFVLWKPFKVPGPSGKPFQSNKDQSDHECLILAKVDCFRHGSLKGRNRGFFRKEDILTRAHSEPQRVFQILVSRRSPQRIFLNRICTCGCSVAGHFVLRKRCKVRITNESFSVSQSAEADRGHIKTHILLRPSALRIELRILMNSGDVYILPKPINVERWKLWILQKI